MYIKKRFFEVIFMVHKLFLLLILVCCITLSVLIQTIFWIDCTEFIDLNLKYVMIAYKCMSNQKCVFENAGHESC